jgi:glyoxylase-like metal-dependent hydrolase (beta-lactamase superfamily II)
MKMFSNNETEMEQKKIVVRLSGFITVVVISVFACNPFISDQTDSVDRRLDSLIRFEKLNDKAILITLGSDAVTAIKTQKGIVVIDAGISTGLTSKYRKIIESAFQRNDFAYLINTHGHADHNGGNSVFAEAVIIGHENCLQEISDQWKDPEKVKSSLLKIVNEYDKALQTLEHGTDEWNDAFCQKARYQYAYNDVIKKRSITKPTLTFGDTLSISMSDATFNMIYFGKAHSKSDILVHIPELKLLMTGDLFFPGGRPSIDDAGKQDVERWKTVMQWIEPRRNDIDKVIGGHGQIMSKKDIEAFNKYVTKKGEELK